MNSKVQWKSKTIVLAILQGIAGILVAFMAANPELQTVGYIAVIKSVIDYFLRLNTTASIE